MNFAGILLDKMKRYNIFILKSERKRLVGKPRRRWQVQCGLNLTTSGYGPLAGYREDGNVTLRYIEGVGSLAQLRDYHPLK
jgi:hypothetical protein